MFHLPARHVANRQVRPFTERRTGGRLARRGTDNHRLIRGSTIGMSIIKPRPRGRVFVPYRARLEHENHETLYVYDTFLGEEPEHVVNAVIDTVLAKDKECAAWRVDHGESLVRPPPPPAPKRVRRRARGIDGARTAGDDAETGSPMRDRTV